MRSRTIWLAGSAIGVAALICGLAWHVHESYVGLTYAAIIVSVGIVIAAYKNILDSVKAPYEWEKIQNEVKEQRARIEEAEQKKASIKLATDAEIKLYVEDLRRAEIDLQSTLHAKRRLQISHGIVLILIGAGISFAAVLSSIGNRHPLVARSSPKAAPLRPSTPRSSPEAPPVRTTTPERPPVAAQPAVPSKSPTPAPNRPIIPMSPHNLPCYEWKYATNEQIGNLEAALSSQATGRLDIIGISQRSVIVEFWGDDYLFRRLTASVVLHPADKRLVDLFILLQPYGDRWRGSITEEEWRSFTGEVDLYDGTLHLKLQCRAPKQKPD